jgi:tight adherence protein B
MPEIAAMPAYLLLLMFLSALCLAAATYNVLADSHGRHQRRVRKRLNRLEGAISYQPEESLLRPSSGALPRLNQWLEQRRVFRAWRRMLLQADLHWQLSTFLALLLAAAALGLALGFLRWGPPGALAGLLLCPALPFKFIALRARRRLKKFEKQLPDALELLSRGLKAGHAFTSGLQLVADEMPDPIGGEFFKTFKEYNHGMDLNTALLNLCQRIDLRDLRFFTTAVMIQRETGGNLAEILDKIASLIRERFKLRNQIQALTAEGRLSGLILVLLPPATALALFILNPDYVRLLWTHRLGRMMAGGAMFFQLMGLLTIRKIVTVKV